MASRAFATAEPNRAYQGVGRSRLRSLPRSITMMERGNSSAGMDSSARRSRSTESDSLKSPPRKRINPGPSAFNRASSRGKSKSAVMIMRASSRAHDSTRSSEARSRPNCEAWTASCPWRQSQSANFGESGISTRNFTGRIPPFLLQRDRQQSGGLRQCPLPLDMERLAELPREILRRQEVRAGGKQENASCECTACRYIRLGLQKYAEISLLLASEESNRASCTHFCAATLQEKNSRELAASLVQGNGKR